MKNTNLEKRGKAFPSIQPTKTDALQGGDVNQRMSYAKGAPATDAKFKKGGMVAKPLTLAVRKSAEKADDAFDRKRGIKENSPRDIKLDAKRGLMEDVPSKRKR